MVLHRAVTSSGLFHLRRSPFVQCGQAESARKQWEHAADAEAAIAAGNDYDANDKETTRVGGGGGPGQARVLALTVALCCEEPPNSLYAVIPTVYQVFLVKFCKLPSTS